MIGILSRHIVYRTTARVLLCAEDHVLLTKGRDPFRPGEAWWFAVGGGVDDGEKLEAAARREVAEETGIDDFELGPRVLLGNAAFPYWDNQFIYQTEHYFLGWTATRQLSRAAWTDIERRQLLDMAWWGLAEMRSTSELIVPRELPELLPGLLRGEIPAEPIAVGDYT